MSKVTFSFWHCFGFIKHPWFCLFLRKFKPKSFNNLKYIMGNKNLLNDWVVTWLLEWGKSFIEQEATLFTLYSLDKKWNLLLSIYLVFLRIWPNFTKETLTGKLHFLCSDYISNTIFYPPFNFQIFKARYSGYTEAATQRCS